MTKREFFRFCNNNIKTLANPPSHLLFPSRFRLHNGSDDQDPRAAGEPGQTAFRAGCRRGGLPGARQRVQHQQGAGEYAAADAAPGTAIHFHRAATDEPHGSLRFGPAAGLGSTPALALSTPEKTKETPKGKRELWDLGVLHEISDFSVEWANFWDFV